MEEEMRGLKFPLEIHPATGQFMTSTGAQSVKESVYLILMTQKTERFTRPEFGSTIWSYPFTDPTSTRLHMMEQEIRSTILTQEPRIQEVEVTVDYQRTSPEILVRVDYTMNEGAADYVEIPL